MIYYRPFDPQYYEDEFEDEEMLDEEGRTRLKLKVLLQFFLSPCHPLGFFQLYETNRR